jgi:CelD/BcsL family acetyltransferase involved in cellulose biosynthesis
MSQLPNKRLTSINPLEDERWDRFVEQHEHGTIFTCSAWLKTLKASYGYPVRAFVRESNKGDLLAAVPLVEVRPFWITPTKWICVPFSDFAPPLVGCDARDASLFSFIAEEGNKAKVRQIQIRGSLSDEVGTFKGISHFVTHELILPGNAETLFQKLHRSQGQRQIKRAFREGVRLEMRKDTAAVNNFHRLDVITRRRQGVPPHPKVFLYNLHKYVIQQNKGFFIEATLGGQIVASYLFLLYGKTILYKYGASDKRYFGSRANHLVIWEAMKWGINNGYIHFHFGRTCAFHNTLKQFKQRPWRSIERPLPYFFWNARGSVKEQGMNEWVTRLETAAFRIIPSRLSIPLSDILYKHFS